jgi:hypothetical protein
MAEEVGKSLGKSQILQRPLSKSWQQEKLQIAPTEYIAQLTSFGT